MSWNTWVHAENEQPFLTPTTSASFLKSPFHSPSLWTAYCPCPKKVTLHIADFPFYESVSPQWPITDTSSPTTNSWAAFAFRQQSPATKRTRSKRRWESESEHVHFALSQTIYCQRVKVTPIKEDGANLWRDLRTSSRPLVWARHISSNKEQYLFENFLHRHKRTSFADTSPVCLIMHVEFKVSVFFSR